MVFALEPPVEATALPSALAVESVLPFAESVSAPVAPGAPTVSASGSVAVWSTTLMVTAIAAATWSGLLLPELSFSLDSALGVGFAPETFEPDPLLSSVAFLPPRSRWSETSWSTVRFELSGLVREASSSAAAPFADAVASDDAAESASALIVTAPPAASERFVVAVAECSARVKPSEKPMALSGAVDAPVAFDETAADCVAVMPIAPVAVSVPPGCVPIVALVETMEIATATTGVIASPDAVVAFAPFFASTTELWPPVAETLTLCAPLIVARSPMKAVVVSSTTETAIERPRPNAAPAVSPASALVVETESGSAVIATSPLPPESVTIVPFASDALLDASTRLNASEPATEFLPPPAPLVASAP